MPTQLHCEYNNDFEGNQRHLEIYSCKGGAKLVTITINNGFVDIYDEMERTEYSLLEVTNGGLIINNLSKLNSY